MGDRPDYALTSDPAGAGPMLHRVDCPAVQAARRAGEIVVTMFMCEREPPADVPRHRCLITTPPRSSDHPRPSG
jgi:hypothetical protein